MIRILQATQTGMETDIRKTKMDASKRDDWGNRICMVDSETGMAYVTDSAGRIIVWPLDENNLPIYYKDGGVTWLENEWVTSESEGAYEIARIKQGAYILEETAVPLADGYVQAMAVGVVIEDKADRQSFAMENDYTKTEISKVDMTSREEIEGAELTLYEAYRVYDDSNRGWHLEILLDTAGEPIVAERWISDGGQPHWIDHIMPGDNILRETRVPTESGYVTASDVEVIIAETGEVQGAVMEDDHTAIEIVKIDAGTGEPMDNAHRATLALYPVITDENGEPVYDAEGRICYDAGQLIHKWQTDDGSEVKKTAHQESIAGGHSYTAYDAVVRYADNQCTCGCR